MDSEEIKKILSAAEPIGWVLEPEAKRLLSLVGLGVPRFLWTREMDEAVAFAQQVGYPVVAKVVSPNALHKSDVNGVVVGIDEASTLREVFRRFEKIEGFAGMLVESQVSGTELIVGAKIDYQFGPVILLGMGGTGVEIYEDTSLRMAPLGENDAAQMVKELKAHPLLEGYRGARPVDLSALSRLLVTLSDVVLEIEPFIESLDLNPVICCEDRCVVADARILLSTAHGQNASPTVP
jgi:acyl-CoA synthetase (NDP forming)